MEYEKTRVYVEDDDDGLAAWIIVTLIVGPLFVIVFAFILIKTKCFVYPIWEKKKAKPLDSRTIFKSYFDAAIMEQELADQVEEEQEAINEIKRLRRMKKIGTRSKQVNI